MSDPNRQSFKLAISPPPTDGSDASTAAASPLGSKAKDTPHGAGGLLHLTLSVETPGRDIIRISAIDSQGRSYEGMLSLRLVAGEGLCYICDADGCRWVSPCP